MSIPSWARVGELVECCHPGDGLDPRNYVIDAVAEDATGRCRLFFDDAPNVDDYGTDAGWFTWRFSPAQSKGLHNHSPRKVGVDA